MSRYFASGHFGSNVGRDLQRCWFMRNLETPSRDPTGDKTPSNAARAKRGNLASSVRQCEQPAATVIAACRTRPRPRARARKLQSWVFDFPVSRRSRDPANCLAHYRSDFLSSSAIEKSIDGRVSDSRMFAFAALEMRAEERQEESLSWQGFLSLSLPLPRQGKSPYELARRFLITKWIR